MPASFAFLVFLFGVVIGSFLNVVIFRYNTGRSVRGRSHCFACSTTLRWYELVPLVSFLVLRGRCRHCQSKLSLQYYLVELLTGVVFTLTVARLLELGYLSFSVLLGAKVIALYLVAMALLIAIAVYDYRHKIIPDGLVYALILCGFLRVVFSHMVFPGTYPWFVDIVSGAVLAFGFALLWLVSRGRWMGFGDAKLVLGLGWLLPFSQNLASTLIAFWIGAVVGLVLIAVSRIHQRFTNRRVTLASELPFAPFLILAFFVTFLFHIDMGMLVSWFQI